MVLVTGVKGQLGYDVVKELNKRNIDCLGVDKDDFDITDKEQTLDFIKNNRPNVVVHCAAYTAVSDAEDNIEICRKVNILGTENIAVACKAIDAKMVYISTDYVYGGNGDTPYNIGDETAPKSIYGITKLEGENAVRAITDKYFIIRTSWVFGINGNNFVKTMLNLADTHDELKVVNDQVGSPTYTPDLARLICDMLVTEKYGIYHATNENYCSWADFATEIMKRGNKNCKIKSITTAQYNSRADRPLNSRLSKKCLDDAGFERLPIWQDALDRYFEELKINETVTCGSVLQ